MRHYKIIAGILLILPIINFAFALPIAVKEARQLSGGVVPDIAIAMLTKRGDETETQSNGNFESLSGKGESSAARPPSGSAQSESDLGPMNGHALPQNPTSSTAPNYRLEDPAQMRTSQIQEEPLKSPSDFLLESSGSSSSLDRYPASPDYFGSAGEYLASPGSSMSEASDAGSTTASPMRETPKSERFLSKLFSKIKFWRRISGPGSIRNAVNAAKRELQDVVDTGTYVSVSNLEFKSF